MSCLELLEAAAKFAPLATAAIALGAALIAWNAIRTQKDIARRRAAIDFFLKTETDQKLIDLYNIFKKEIKQVAVVESMESVLASPRYEDVRSFLNLCELIAVGIRRKAFSDDVSFHYWGDVLRDSFRDARPLILHVRTKENRPATYLDLEWLCNEWRSRS